MFRILVEIGTTLNAEPCAVIPTQGLEWQIKYHRIAEHRLKVDQIAMQPASEVVVGFDAWVHIQLLNVDLQLIGDRP
jgi:hypothetical protein